MLIGIMTLGFFGIPIGLFACALLGLWYGIRQKDKLFIKYSLVVLILDVAFMICFYMQLQQM